MHGTDADAYRLVQVAALAATQLLTAARQTAARVASKRQANTAPATPLPASVSGTHQIVSTAQRLLSISGSWLGTVTRCFFRRLPPSPSLDGCWSPALEVAAKPD